jgi:orotidine-5'-phosphate decarboxylase
MSPVNPARPLSRDQVRERVAIALDVGRAAPARNLARQLHGRVGWLKVGLQLYTSEGGPLVRELAGAGHRVFLDLKLHDIPNTVAAATAEAFRLGAGMVNVHAAGGISMMRAAAESADREARRSGRTGPDRPQVLAVTALTSLDEDDLGDVGLLGPAEELVCRLALLARRAGCSGIVCSPREIGPVRARCGRDLLIVTPGIRPAWAGGGDQRADDQKRVATPAEALAAGADLIVIGRPVTQADDPASAVERILDEIESSELRSPS